MKILKTPESMIKKLYPSPIKKILNTPQSDHETQKNPQSDHKNTNHPLALSRKCSIPLSPINKILNTTQSVNKHTKHPSVGS